MKNRIAILGGSMFMNMNLSDGEYKIIQNKVLTKLEERYMVDNFSSASLNSKKATSFLNVFMQERKYKYCILALGEADMKNGTIEEFKSNLSQIVELTKKFQTCPLLVSLPTDAMQDEAALLYQQVIDELAFKENIEYISYGDSEVETTYTVKNANQMKRALLDICI